MTMDDKAKIAINTTCAQEKPTGLGGYTHELLLELLKLESNIDFTVYSSSLAL